MEATKVATRELRAALTTCIAAGDPVAVSRRGHTVLLLHPRTGPDRSRCRGAEESLRIN